MGLKLAAVAAIAFGLLAAPAFGQSTTVKKRVISRGDTVVVMRDENGRARTRIIVQRRSYLDPGTEVRPYTDSSFDYAVPPTHSPTYVIDKTAAGLGSPLHGPFDIPSKNNPWQW